MVTRIAVIADIHHGRDTATKRGSAALGLLDRFIATVNTSDVHAVLDLGDRISDENVERDRMLQQEVAARFRRIDGKPRHHMLGNHDVAKLSLNENAELLDAPLDSRSMLVGDVRAVFWQPDVAMTLERPPSLRPGDLATLEKLLAADDRPTLLVSHVPLSGHSQAGNYYFERNPQFASYAETADIRRVIADAPCPLVALAGHVHWNTLTTIDGTPHLTLQSLTETFTCAEPAACTATIEIDGDEFRWRVDGVERMSLTLPWPTSKIRWRPANQTYAAKTVASA